MKEEAALFDYGEILLKLATVFGHAFVAPP